jgi:hypothetical protein
VPDSTAIAQGGPERTNPENGNPGHADLDGSGHSEHPPYLRHHFESVEQQADA